jgi:hypothetical protein
MGKLSPLELWSAAAEQVVERRHKDLRRIELEIPSWIDAPLKDIELNCKFDAYAKARVAFRDAVCERQLDNCPSFGSRLTDK